MLLMTPDGERVVVDLKDDDCLYDAPHNPPNTGTRFTSGTDYYAHKARSGKNYFYSYSWSMWQGTQDRFELLEEEDIKARLFQLAGLTYPEQLGPDEIDKIEEYFPGLFDEDA